MLKALRKVTETFTVGQEDAETKKHIAEIRDAATTLAKTLGYWYKTFADHAANTMAVHEDMANLYPANESLSVAVAKLNNSAAVFQEATAGVDDLKKTFDPAIAELLAKLADLSQRAQERAVVRQEIEHYKKKVVTLANDGLTDAKKQVKAESNQAKLAENQSTFRRLDEEITATLSRLDSDIATLHNAAFTKFMQLQAKTSHAALGMYTASLDSIGVAPALAAAPPAAPPAAPEMAATEGAGAAPVETEDAGAAAPAAPAMEGAGALPASEAAAPPEFAAAGDAAAAPPAEPVAAPETTFSPEASAPPSAPVEAAPAAPAGGNPF